MVGSSLRPEALPALDDADVGRDGAPLALDAHASPAAPTPAARPARWASRSPRPSRSPPRTRTPTTRSARCSTTSCCTRRSSARRRSRRWRWPARSPTSSSAASAAARTSAGWRSRGCGASCAAGARPALRRRRAGGLPDADQGRLRLRLRRHRRADAAHADVHARPRLRPAAGARRRPALPRRRADRLRAGEGRLIEARAYRQNETFEAALQFARTEGIIPAPEPAHAIRAAIEEALAAQARPARSA